MAAGQALCDYLDAPHHEGRLVRHLPSQSRCLLGPKYRGNQDCTESAWVVVDNTLTEASLGPSKATAALRDPASSRYQGILSPTNAAVCALR